jgi:hypothetical protein
MHPLLVSGIAWFFLFFWRNVPSEPKIKKEKQIQFTFCFYWKTSKRKIIKKGKITSLKKTERIKKRVFCLHDCERVPIARSDTIHGLLGWVQLHLQGLVHHITQPHEQHQKWMPNTHRTHTEHRAIFGAFKWYLMLANDQLCSPVMCCVVVVSILELQCLLNVVPCCLGFCEDRWFLIWFILLILRFLFRLHWCSCLNTWTSNLHQFPMSIHTFFFWIFHIVRWCLLQWVAHTLVEFVDAACDAARFLVL